MGRDDLGGRNRPGSETTMPESHFRDAGKAFICFQFSVEALVKVHKLVTLTLTGTSATRARLCCTALRGKLAKLYHCPRSTMACGLQLSEA